MKEPLPMPIHRVIRHPIMNTLTNSAWHNLVAMCVAYWEAECRDLPTTDTALLAITRSDVATWRRNAVQVLTGFRLIAGDLRELRENAICSKERRVVKARIANSVRNANLRKRQEAEAPLHAIPEPPRTVVGAPSHASRGYETGKGDMAARQAAVDRQRHADRAARLKGRIRVGLVDVGGAESIAPPTSNPRDDWVWQPTETAPAIAAE